jgi:hypothetical protein
MADKSGQPKKPLFNQVHEEVKKGMKDFMAKKKLEHDNQLQKAREKQDKK